MSAQHTPGPWAAFTDDSDGAPHTNIVAVVPRTACVFALPGHHKNDPDVRLIAAAPDLLAALGALIPTNVNLDHPGLSDDVTLPCDVSLGELRRARAAIAKATGADHQ